VEQMENEVFIIGQAGSGRKRLIKGIKYFFIYLKNVELQNGKNMENPFLGNVVLDNKYYTATVNLVRKDLDDVSLFQKIPEGFIFCFNLDEVWIFFNVN
jgi:hypothetical protein